MRALWGVSLCTSMIGIFDVGIWGLFLLRDGLGWEQYSTSALLIWFLHLPPPSFCRWFLHPPPIITLAEWNKNLMKFLTILMSFILENFFEVWSWRFFVFFIFLPRDTNSILTRQIFSSYCLLSIKGWHICCWIIFDLLYFFI